MLWTGSLPEAKTAHIRALFRYFREEELKMVLRGDFIPALCTRSQLARPCLNIRISSERKQLERS